MTQNPLQTLKIQPYPVSENSIKPLLESVEDIENDCDEIYQKLTARTKQLADDVLEAKFSWRVRVGGMRGFRELILPVFHPVYGVPYIPASSLKGAISAYANSQANTEQQKAEIQRILGDIDRGIGTVQILDAFPTQPCLSVDITNNQWNWDENKVKYQPVPHFLLSMEEPEILIGLKLTAKGRSHNNDLVTVKSWLQEALQGGIGSRVSNGYGRTTVNAGLPFNCEYHFQFYSEGIHGAFPPSKENNWQGENEFRPVALRGILRYWFRAIALGLYSVETSQKLESQFFGELNEQGSIRLGITINEEKNKIKDNPNKEPYYSQGYILLETKTKKELDLIESLLKFVSHIGGFGRGSRRPLHLNNRRLRGCFWELSDFILPYDQLQWSSFITELLDNFRAVKAQPKQRPNTLELKNRSQRYQDIFDQNTRICLIPSNQLLYPNEVDNWFQDGYKKYVRGEGLNLLYSSNNFKGVNLQGDGNPDVGGKLETPSYVWIQSNYPENDILYQVVTIFGTNHKDRKEFAKQASYNSICIKDFFDPSVKDP